MENGVSIEMTPGSDNIFADIGLPEADDHKLKAQIVIHMKLLMDAEGLNQAEAARRMNIAQPNLSRLLRGQFRGVSIAKLLFMLNALGQDVEIRVKPKPARRCAARTALKAQKPAAA